MKPQKMISCQRCGKEFLPRSNAAKNCPECRLDAEREYTAKYNARKRQEKKQAKEKEKGDKPNLDRRLKDLKLKGISYAEWQKMKTLEMIRDGR